MTELPHDALVLVGDGARAIFFRNTGSTLSPKLAVENVFEQDNPPTREQGTDKPTRGVSGAPRGNIEQTDWHQLNEDRFASEIADKLYQLAHTNRLGRLVIVAPPKILGTLRQSLHKEVLDHIEAEVPKELASMPVSAIQQQIATW